MRAVVDTNVWVSALLDSSSLPGQLLSAHDSGRFTVITSDPVLDELAAVLARPKLRRRGVTPEAAEVLLDLLHLGGDPVQIRGDIHVCADPDDDVFIETAIRGNADVVVTGDATLLRTAVSDVRILSVRAFLEALEEE